MAVLLRSRQTHSHRNDPHSRRGESRSGREGAVRKDAGRLTFPAIRTRHRVPLSFLLALSSLLVLLLATASYALDTTAGQSAGDHGGHCAESSVDGSRTCAASGDASPERSDAYPDLKTSENEAEFYPDESADDGGSRKPGSVEHDVAGSERAMVEELLTWMGLDWTRDSDGPEYGIVVDGTIEVSATNLHHLVQGYVPCREMLRVCVNASRFATSHMLFHKLTRVTFRVSCRQVDFSTRSVHDALPESRGASANPEGGTTVWKPNDTRADIGFKAARRIEAGEVILIVPRKFFIVANWIALNESERHLLPYDMQLPVPYGWDTYTVLAAWLLRERAKGAASPWARFLRSLPAYVPLPALFPQTLIDDFEYWPIVDQATHLKAAYADLYDRCNPTAIANATRSEFYWALAIVTSRCFTFSPSLRARGGGEEKQGEGAEGAEGVEGDGQGGEDGAEVAAEAAGEAGGESDQGSSGNSGNSSSVGERGEDWYATSAAMLPFADLFNHDYYPNMGWKLSGENFLFTTYQAIEKGEPLSISYGAKPTIDMVAEYGFVPAYNPFDTVILFPSSARLVEYTVQQTHLTQPRPTQSHSANATLRGALRVAAVVREVVERMREERRTGVQQGQGRAEEEGEGQEAHGEEGQGGVGQGGEAGQKDGTSGDGSRGGEWWEGMESEEEEWESAKKQLVVWAGGHVSPEMLAMAAAVWHWINTGRGEWVWRG
ncbi:unnamed protein product [Closterium sp. Yama58-4]|nr:unnamed protein product [Closterium sp. Yama58-4]